MMDFRFPPHDRSMPVPSTGARPGATNSKVLGTGQPIVEKATDARIESCVRQALMRGYNNQLAPELTVSVKSMPSSMYLKCGSQHLSCASDWTAFSK